MENASKALIIAGAILLSILIIALGIYIYNQAKAAMGEGMLDEQILNNFNEPIVNYEGRQTGSSVKNLLSKLVANAGTYEGNADYLPSFEIVDATTGNNASVTGGNAAATNGTNYINQLSAAKSKLVNSHTYTITVEYAGNGLVNKIIATY